MGSVGPGDVAWYLDDHCDEVMPCDASLEAWADWLSKPDPSWPHDIPADGDRFEASRIRFEDDIVATRRGGGEWTFSRPIEGAPSLVAVRYGERMGWSPDNIVWGEDMELALREWFSENAEECDGVEYVAVGYDEPKAVLIYKADPPRLVIDRDRTVDADSPAA